MSSVKISELVLLSQVTADDFFPFVDSSSFTTYRSTVQSLLNLVAVSGSVISASYSPTASYSLSASYAFSSTSASYALSASYGLSGSYALTSSYSTGLAQSSSYAVSASYSLSASYAMTSSYGFTSSYSLSSSYSLTSSYGFTSSYSLSSSYARTSSFGVSSSYALTSSYGTSASYSFSASYAPNIGVNGSQLFAAGVEYSFLVSAAASNAIVNNNKIYFLLDQITGASYGINQFCSIDLSTRNVSHSLVLSSISDLTLSSNADYSPTPSSLKYFTTAGYAFNGKVNTVKKSGVDKQFYTFVYQPNKMAYFNLETNAIEGNISLTGTAAIVTTSWTPVWITGSIATNPSSSIYFMFSSQGNRSNDANGQIKYTYIVKATQSTGNTYTCTYVSPSDANYYNFTDPIITNGTTSNIFSSGYYSESARSLPSLAFCDYNPIKNRLYVIPYKDCFMHIFEFDSGKTLEDGLYNGIYGTSVTRPSSTNLFYVKTIALGNSSVDYWAADEYAPVFNVVTDQTTGEEIGITCVRNKYNFYGSKISYAPWIE